MGLLTRECVNELRTAHDRVAGGLDNLERFLQTVRLTYMEYISQIEVRLLHPMLSLFLVSD